jgi:aryl-alcohol dehydrogenase-like predicted oxidoreductase
MRKPLRAFFASVVLALVAGYFVLGHYLYKLPIGLDASAFLAGPTLHQLALRFDPELQNAASGLVLLIASALGVAVLAFLLVRGAVRAKADSVDPLRRRFLTGAGAGAGAALVSLLVASATAAARGLLGFGTGHQGWAGVGKYINDKDIATTHPEWKDAWKGSRVRDYRRLGRTGWEVSDIVLGTGRIRGEDGERIARAAIDRGVNYFDTSPDYSGAGSEQAMGRAIRGVRDQLFIATKFCTPMGHLPPGTPVAAYKEAVEGSLRRLGTDYVDLCHIHSCDEVERLLDPNVHEAFDQLKQEGKVRFLGVSSHTPNLVEVANRAVASGRFDVMMLAYHHGLWAPMDEIVARARREQDMGVVAMKTLKGAKHHGLAGFREQADAYSQAALRWALSNPDVSCAVISFFELQHVDEYLSASGSRLTPDDLALLERYDREIAGSYCAPHCGQCLSSCPEGLPIHDVLRHRMYFEDYGWEKEGMRLYGQLEKNASACAGCSAPCLGSCPYGLPIQERMTGAHELLTLS